MARNTPVSRINPFQRGDPKAMVAGKVLSRDSHIEDVVSKEVQAMDEAGDDEQPWRQHSHS